MVKNQFNKEKNELYELFQLFLKSKQIEKAIELIQPENCAIAFEIGLFYGQHDSIEVALRIFDRLTQICPRDALFWLNKGVALVRLGREWDAMQCFIQATQKNPALSGAWCEIGSLFVRWEEYRKAIKSFEKAHDVPPCYAKNWWCKGFEFLMKRRYKTALKYFDEALHIDPTLEDGFIEKGIALTRLQRIPEALLCFKDALKLNQNARTFHYMGIAYLKAGIHDKALRSFNAALHLNDKLPEIWVGKAIAAERLNFIRDAHQCLDKALELKQDYDLAWFNKAVLLDRQGKKAAAAESFEHALDINPILLKPTPMRWNIPNENNWSKEGTD